MGAAHSWSASDFSLDQLIPHNGTGGIIGTRYLKIPNTFWPAKAPPNASNTWIRNHHIHKTDTNAWERTSEYDDKLICITTVARKSSHQRYSTQKKQQSHNS